MPAWRFFLQPVIFLRMLTAVNRWNNRSRTGLAMMVSTKMLPHSLDVALVRGQDE
jgi:hypothetical protein